MGYAATLNGTASIVLAILIIAAGAGIYLFRQSKFVEKPRFFAPRNRRLTFIERASLDNGRRLLLIRRDDVEHLVMIGGPIDVVIETGIRSQVILHGLAKENDFSDAAAFSPLDKSWPPREPSLSMDNPPTPAEPQASLSSQTGRVKEEKADSTPQHGPETAKPVPESEAKAAAQ